MAAMLPGAGEPAAAGPASWPSSCSSHCARPAAVFPGLTSPSEKISAM
eukprot:CAMPEP_0202898486 /NCGR_PEP_ID=MMETSP1392-20130828/7002_1 /ASSEMBLY_ACC=CAM_ASM_000868 /TAXON_ID=225041 /ORGANISM="Chlamydomonas chlamydogama, Strain SAG 11-48b" /LENGTH=47 /DNA_ID= /DNA_START= /DNA_END= /DNA_ORIENTATION=